MQVVIEITEETYQYMQSRFMYQSKDESNSSIFEKAGVAIKNGTPLPKGHGDLKDFQKMYADMSNREELARRRVIDTPTNSPCYLRYVAQLNERTAFREMLFDAPTIIEADKEDEE